MFLGREAGKPKLDIESRERVAEAPAQEVRRCSTEAQRRATGRHCLVLISLTYLNCHLYTLTLTHILSICYGGIILLNKLVPYFDLLYLHPIISSYLFVPLFVYLYFHLSQKAEVVYLSVYLFLFVI